MCGITATLLMAEPASAANIRYKQSGPWGDLSDIGQTSDWQKATLPSAVDGDTVRANWGNNTVTLDFATTVTRFQIGVDESGAFHILSGGTLTGNGSNKIGNNNTCTGIVTVGGNRGGQIEAYFGLGKIATDTPPLVVTYDIPTDTTTITSSAVAPVMAFVATLTKTGDGFDLS